MLKYVRIYIQKLKNCVEVYYTDYRKEQNPVYSKLTSILTEKLLL